MVAVRTVKSANHILHQPYMVVQNAVEGNIANLHSICPPPPIFSVQWMTTIKFKLLPINSATLAGYPHILKFKIYANQQTQVIGMNNFVVMDTQVHLEEYTHQNSFVSLIYNT